MQDVDGVLRMIDLILLHCYLIQCILYITVHINPCSMDHVSEIKTTYTYTYKDDLRTLL